MEVSTIDTCIPIAESSQTSTNHLAFQGVPFKIGPSSYKIIG